MLYKLRCTYVIYIWLFVIKKTLSTTDFDIYNGTNVSTEVQVMPKSWLAITFLIHEGQHCICKITKQKIGKDILVKHENLSTVDQYTRNKHDYQPLNFSMPLCPRPICPEYRHDDHKEVISDLTSFQTYGYSILAVLLISLCSIAGVLLIPCLRTRIYKYVITGFIAFGLGFMIGDAVLHLIPEAIGNDCGDDSHGHQGALWRQVLIMLTIFGLFTFETIMDLAHHQDKTSHRCPRRHSHSHIPFPEDILPWTEGKQTCSSPSHPETPTGSCHGPAGAVPVNFILHDTETTNSRELKPLAMVILLGDAVHNFGDGLAVGAAFTSGLQSGISTSLAIFCHELPHEFGDFVILRSTGLSIQYALLANLASALTAFLGLFVGVSLGFEQTTRQWIFAFTAAMFLYIAVGDMLPELRNHNKSFSVLAVQSASMLVGMGIVLLMHIYVEESF